MGTAAAGALLSRRLTCDGSFASGSSLSNKQVSYRECCDVVILQLIGELLKTKEMAQGFCRGNIGIPANSATTVRWRMQTDSIFGTLLA
jgi:hypothetical protein